jgi:hypothetical protein
VGASKLIEEWSSSLLGEINHMRQEINQLKIGINLISSDCIEIILEATINNLEYTFWNPTIEFCNRLIDSGYTRILLNCSGLVFYDAPHVNLFVFIQKHLQERGGRMVVLGLDELDRKSTQMFIPDGYLHFENDRNVAIMFLIQS